MRSHLILITPVNRDDYPYSKMMKVTLRKVSRILHDSEITAMTQCVAGV